MSRIGSTGISAVRPRVTSELSYDGKPKSDDRGRSRDPSRPTVPDIPSIKQRLQNFQPDDASKTAPVYRGNRPATTGTSSVPEIRVQTTAENQTSQPKRQRMDPADPIHMEDPERYFESTNHTERFQHTRAMFAKMEEQTRLEQERRRQMFHRSKSPTRFPVKSATSLAISPAIVTGDVNQSLPSPASSSDSDYRPPATKFTRESRTERPRVSSASVDTRDTKTEATVPTMTARSGSVDRLDEDAPYASSSLRDSAKSISRSETDLGRSAREPLWPNQHDDVVRKNAAIFGGQVTRRRTRHIDEVDSRPERIHKDEASRPPPVADKKPSLANSQPGAESIPHGLSSHVRQNYSDRIGAPKLPPPSANIPSRYGRLEKQSSTGPASESQAQPLNAVVTKPVATEAEGNDRDTAARPTRRSTTTDDDSVERSLDAWKIRRRISGKHEDPENEHARQTPDENPSPITDHHLNHHLNALNSAQTDQSSPTEFAQVETIKPAASEPSSIFGVALRSTASKVDQEVAPRTEVGAEPETRVPDFAGSVSSPTSEPVPALDTEADVHGQLAKPAEDALSDLPTDDTGKVKRAEVNTEDPSDRRQSLELAEVPHFPKDSVMLTGSHRSLSPRSSSDDSHHLPPSLPDQKPNDQTEDSVFVNEHTQTERSDSQQLNSCTVPSTGTKPESDADDAPSVDHLLSSETSR